MTRSLGIDTMHTCDVGFRKSKSIIQPIPYSAILHQQPTSCHLWRLLYCACLLLTALVDRLTFSVSFIFAVPRAFLRGCWCWCRGSCRGWWRVAHGAERLSDCVTTWKLKCSVLSVQEKVKATQKVLFCIRETELHNNNYCVCNYACCNAKPDKHAFKLWAS